MNYEFKGTPGPWRIGTQHDNVHIGFLDDGQPYNSVQDCKYGFRGKDKDGFSVTGIVSEETARLMASAPDLLDACINILNCYEITGIDIDQVREAVHKALNINQ